MAKKSKAIDAPAEYEPTLNFDFPKGKKTPKGFDLLDVDHEVTVKVTGKVRSIRHDTDSKSFGMTFDKVKLSFPGKPKTIAEAQAADEEKRRA